MKKIIKNLFCNHIWKTYHKEYLRNIRMQTISGPIIGIDEYKVYVIYSVCIKCGKRKYQNVKN